MSSDIKEALGDAASVATEVDVPSALARLRKRAFHGRDHTLKRTVALLRYMQATHDSLQDTQRLLTQRQQQRPNHNPSQWRSASTAVPRAYFRPVSPWSDRAFLAMDEAWYLCDCANLDEPLVADCNDVWAARHQTTKDTLLGRSVSSILERASWERFRLGLQMVLQHGMILVRNVPACTANVVVDLIAWIEYADGSQQMQSSSSGNIAARKPKYIQLLTMNARPRSEAPPPMVPPSSSGSSASSSNYFDASASSSRSESTVAAAVVPPAFTDGAATIVDVDICDSTSPSPSSHARSSFQETDRVGSALGRCAVFLPLHNATPDCDVYLVSWEK